MVRAVHPDNDSSHFCSRLLRTNLLNTSVRLQASQEDRAEGPGPPGRKTWPARTAWRVSTLLRWVPFRFRYQIFPGYLRPAVRPDISPGAWTQPARGWEP